MALTATGLKSGLQMFPFCFSCPGSQDVRGSGEFKMRMMSVLALGIVGQALLGSVPACAQDMPTPHKDLGTPADRQALAAAEKAYGTGNFKEALSIFTSLAEKGNGSAQYDLGVMYRDGGGVPRDYGVAVGWFQKSADQGSVDAQYSLGALYLEGEGVPRDPALAAKWLRKAADQGDVWSEYNLGLQYSDGEGVPRNYAMAAGLYKKAADQGHAMSQYNLGVMYTQGLGVDQDYAAAATWYRKAADRGLANAQYNLATQYARGQGVPRNPVQAYKWLSLVVLNSEASDDRDRAAKERREVAFQMTKAQITEAEKQVKAWRRLPGADQNSQ